MQRYYFFFIGMKKNRIFAILLRFVAMNPTSSDIRWYVLRCIYGRELALCENIRTTFGIESFVPLEKVRQKDVHGRFHWVQRSALTGYIFVHTDRETLANIVKRIGNVRTMVKRDEEGLFVPVVINDKSMSDFIRVSGSKEQQALYLDPVKLHFRAGDRVRVIGGSFVGLEGYFVQVGAKHEKRVLIQLDTLIAVATAAIPASLVEKI